MKKLIVLFALCFALINTSFSQDVFLSNAISNYGIIPSDGTEKCCSLVMFHIFPSVLDTFYGVQQVCLDIQHTDPTDLQIVLKSNAGTAVVLAQNNGGGSAFPDMTNVCFDMEANVSIGGVVASLNDQNLIPIGNLGEFNNGQIGEGLWQLCITDTDSIDGGNGFINDWNITLHENNNLPDNGYIEFPVCNTNCTVGCQCQDSTAEECLLLPDVVVVRNIMESEHTEYPDYLTVTSATANIGYGTIEFHGTNEWFCDGTSVAATTICPDGSYPKQKIEQRIYKKSSTQTVDYVDVVAGYMQFHSAEGHDHPHIDSWVHNSIRIKGRDENNPLTWPIISVGSKVSFCAVNSIQCSGGVTNYCEYDGVNYHVDNDLVNGRMGQFYGCNFQTQGVSVGYSDVYNQNLPGQEILFSGNICNGKYYIVSHFDPDSVFTEISKANNVSYVPVYLGRQQTACCTTNFEAVEVVTNGNDCEYEFNDLTQPEANSWLWDFGDGTTSTDQFPTHIYTSLDTTYQVSLTTNNDSSCTNSYMKNIYVQPCVVSTNDVFNDKFELQVSPNPFYDFTNLKMVLEQQSSLKIEVYNTLNQKVKTIQNLEEVASGEKNYQINLSDIGIYYLQIEINGQRLIKKIVKF